MNKIIENGNYEIKEIKPSYYHKGISPFEYIRSNKLDYFEGNVIKYITRYKDKNGLEDLLKAETYLKEIIRNYKKQVHNS